MGLSPFSLINHPQHYHRIIRSVTTSILMKFIYESRFIIVNPVLKNHDLRFSTIHTLSIIAQLSNTTVVWTLSNSLVISDWTRNILNETGTKITRIIFITVQYTYTRQVHRKRVPSY